MLESIPAPLTPGTAGLFSNKTRDRILASSLILFNERGFGAVTTASIARHAGVLEGSLWYHFNTKKDLLVAHIDVLQQVFLSENQDAQSDDAETIVAGIFRSYDVIWDFRYILRDDFQVHLDPDEEALKKTLMINAFLDEWTEGRIHHSLAQGLLKLEPEEVEPISELTLVIGRYWLDFSRKKYPDATDASLRNRGLKHVFTVLQPHLSPEAHTIIQRWLGAR